jgi:hypothetical protein
MNTSLDFFFVFEAMISSFKSLVPDRSFLLEAIIVLVFLVNDNEEDVVDDDDDDEDKEYDDVDDVDEIEEDGDIELE